MDDDDDNDMNQETLITLGGTKIRNFQKGYSFLSVSNILVKK